MITGPHGTPLVVRSSLTPSALPPSYETATSEKTPWLSLRETLSFDTLRKKATSRTAASTWTLPIRRSSSTPKLSPKKSKSWTPLALRWYTLSFIILVTLALLITLQLLLNRSNRDQGVIFAPDINALSLKRAFLYRYFPTIVAVFYSIFWSWIDLETKRVEPWYRLSKEEGSLGKDSLLLAYPFDFVPLVPLKALRERHWPVFWASFAVVLVAWGLVPVQAGIFSIHRVTQSTPIPFIVSTSHMPVEQQRTQMTVSFAQSVYGIVTLNETLPPYMTWNYTLAPFKPSFVSKVDIGEGAGQWTAPTTMYSLDLTCTPGIHIDNDSDDAANSTTGCRLSVGQTGNLTKGSKLGATMMSPIKTYSAMYVGHNKGNFATYYIDYCPPERSHTFYAAFTRNKEKDEDPPNNVTTIFCEPIYYEQNVNATVEVVKKQPLKVVPLGPKRQLANDVFNTTWMETIMSDGAVASEIRGDVPPAWGIPLYLQQVLDSDLSVGDDANAMKALASLAGGRPLESYLDGRNLGESYEKAYRLLFARAMVEALGSGFATSSEAVGRSEIETDAVMLEPVFCYIVEGLLAVVIVSTVALLYLSATRNTALRSDPSTIASIMAVVAEEQALLADFMDLDCCTHEELQLSVCNKRYRLVSDDLQVSIEDMSPNVSTNILYTRQQTGSSKAIDKPVRPKEFRLWVSIPFVGLFIVLGTLLAVVYSKARYNGLPLPSQNKIVQNILENYIPTALATLIEPMWVLINRLLCLLRPIEELQKGNARPKKSIEVNYSSLPPQLVVFKALRARHIVLAAVCSMSLLSNLLAVSFAGLFFHATVDVQMPAGFQPPYDMKFVSINGSIGPIATQLSPGEMPSGAYRGGEGEDQFLIAESNHTRGTPLPAWTDNQLFYLPFMKIATAPIGVYEAETTAFGAELDCSELPSGAYQSRNVTDEVRGPHSVLGVTVTKGDAKATCVSVMPFEVKSGPYDDNGGYICQKGPVATELVYNLEAAAGTNASNIEQDICWGSVVLGWLRSAEDTCHTEEEKEPNLATSFFVQCQPRLVTGRATVRVDANGQLQEPVRNRTLDQVPHDDDLDKIFSNGQLNLIRQSNRYLFMFATPAWHNDTFASDFINYFVRRAGNSSRLLDPREGLPTFKDVQASLGEAYSNLFSIWLGANTDHLLIPRANTSTVTVQGWRVEKEERLFLTTALFAIAQGILSIYAFVAILVYLRRPGQYLPRLPTNIASIIGLFAASAGVQDMKGTSRYGARERARHLLGVRYGYGNYVGIDGGIHVGIEKVPFVRPRPSTPRKRTILNLRKATTTI